MSTVIDDLVVTIGLDVSKFTAGQREANDAMKKTQEELAKRGKLMEQSSKEVSSTLLSIRNEFLALGAAVVGSQGIKQFIEQMTAANVALSNFSATLNVSPQYVWGLDKAIEEVSKSAGEGAGMLGLLNKQVKDAQLQGGRLPASLTTLAGMVNMNLDQTHGPVAYLKSLAAAAKALADQGPEAKAKASFLLGEGGFDNAQVTAIIRYGAAIDDMAKNRGRLGPSDKDIEVSKQFISDWTIFGEETGKLFQDLLPLLEPIDKVLESINAALDRMNSSEEFSKRYPNLSHPNGQLGPVVGDTLSNIGEALSDDGSPVPYSRLEKLIRRDPVDGRRAAGGPVSDGKQYLVGERGPELFTPGASGAITPNSALGGGVEVDGRPVSRGNPMPVTLTGRDGDGPQSLWEAIFGKDAGGGGGGGGSGPQSLWELMFGKSTGKGGSASGARALGGALSSLFGGGDVGTGSGAGSLTDAITAAASEAAGGDPEKAKWIRQHMEGIRSGESYRNNTYDHYQTSREDSWGPFQLNRMHPGDLGWVFEHETAAERKRLGLGGLEDRRTIGMQLNWVARYVAAHPDLAPWGGPNWPTHHPREADPRWRNSGYVPFPPPQTTHALPSPDNNQIYPDHFFRGPGFPNALSLSSMQSRANVTSSSTSNALHIGRIDVNAPRATNAAEVAGGISDALKMNMFAMLAQSGQV